MPFFSREIFIFEWTLSRVLKVVTKLSSSWLVESSQAVLSLALSLIISTRTHPHPPG